MHLVTSNLSRVSQRLTRLMGIYFGESFPFWYLSEYPKSGGSWVGKVVADYLRLPYPEHSLFPIGCSAVLHNHWTRYNPRMRRCFYVYRDGRDVMVSYYFFRMKGIRQYPDSPWHQGFHKSYQNLFGLNYDPDDIRQNLPRFIEHEMVHPRGCRVNWPTHVRRWHQPDNPGMACLSYEQMLEDPLGTLTRCFEKLDEKAVDAARLQESIDRYSFQRMSGGRKPGQENRNAFVRKGVAGDWMNHFTSEAAQVFDTYAGDVLVMLGYEQDRNWIHNRTPMA